MGQSTKRSGAAMAAGVLLLLHGGCQDPISLCETTGFSDSVLCTSLTVTVPQGLPREPSDATLVLGVPNLTAGATPIIQLTDSAGTVFEFQSSQIQAAANQATVVIGDSTRLRPGTAQVEVTVGTHHGKAALRVYTRPKWGSQQTPLTYDPMTKKTEALRVFYGTYPAGAPTKLYVAEQDASVGVQRMLAAYTGRPPSAGSRQVVAGVDSTDPSAQHAVTAEVALTFHFDVSKGQHVLRSTPLPGGPSTVAMAAFQDKRWLLAGDPQGSFAFLAKGYQLQAFRVTGGLATLSSSVGLNFDAMLGLLAVRHFAIDGTSTVDAVALDGLKLRLLSVPIGSGTLSELTMLSQAATTSLGGKQPVALDLFDLDRDGNPDVVVAIGNPATRTVSAIGWLAYLGGGAFAGYEESPLPAPCTDVRSMAIGDLVGDDKPDVALATAGAVYIYENQAP